MAVQLVRQARLIDPVQGLDQVSDVLVRDGRIDAIAHNIPQPSEPCDVIDASEMLLGPGLVDLYSCSGEPGHESRETLEQLLEAASLGGVTRVHLLPETQPCLDHPGAIQQLLSRRSVESPVQLNVWGAITQDVAGEELSELQELCDQGLAGFSDGQPLQDWLMVQRLLDYAQPLNLPVAFWPCMKALARDGVIRDGIQALNFGLPSLSVAAETVAIASLLELIEQAQTPPAVHLMRVSTARSVALIAEAKARGLAVTASTPWTHLLYDSDVLRRYDPMFRFDPPVGNPADQTALIQGLEAGVIDAIAIDHHAYTYEEKTVPFAQAPPGCPGLAIAFSLLWQTFVTSEKWSASTLWSLLSFKPAQCLQQTPSTLTQGAIAEMILFDPTHPPERSLWSPQPIHGSVRGLWGNQSFQAFP